MKIKPVMRTDEHHLDKHSRILMMDKSAIETVFLGDSLTRRWEDNPELWNTFFGEFKPANFGVGADCIENVQWRILNHEFDNLSPQLIILLIGTNNLADNTESEIVEGIEETIRLLQDKVPGAARLVLGLFPRNEDERGIDYNRKIITINRELEDICQKTDSVFYDVGRQLLREDNTVSSETQPDGLHLNAAGYRLIGPQLALRIRALI